MPVKNRSVSGEGTISLLGVVQVVTRGVGFVLYYLTALIFRQHCPSLSAKSCHLRRPVIVLNDWHLLGASCASSSSCYEPAVPGVCMWSREGAPLEPSPERVKRLD